MRLTSHSLSIPPVGSSCTLSRRVADKPISLYINSPGGRHLGTGYLRHIRPPVATLCVGQACSFAAAMCRRARHARAGSRDDPPAERRRARAGDRHRDPRARNPRDAQRLNQLYVTHTGQSEELVNSAKERDNFMLAKRRSSLASSMQSSTNARARTVHPGAPLRMVRVEAKSRRPQLRYCAVRNNSMMQDIVISPRHYFTGND